MAKSLTRVLGEGTAWTTASTFFLKFVGIAYVFIVLRNLSLYEYGITELVLSIPPLLSILNMQGLTTVLVADMGVEKGKGTITHMRFLYESYAALRIGLGIISWAIIFFSAPLIEQYYNESIANMIRLVSFAFLAGPFRTLTTILYRVALRFRELAFLSSTEEVVKLLTVATTLLVLDMGPTGVIVAFIVAEFLGFILFAPITYRVHKQLFAGSTWTPGWYHPLTLWYAHGKWSVFSSYAGTFGQKIRPWLIKFFVSTEAVALFAAAQGLFQHTISLVPLHKVLAPAIPQYVDTKARFYRLIDKGIKYQVLSYALVALGGVLVFPYMLQYLFPEYVESFTLYQVMLFALIPAGFTSIFNSVFFALKAQRNLFFAYIKATTFSLVLLPIALLSFGVMGAALEFVITAVYLAFERYRAVKKLLPDFAFHLKDFSTFDELDRKLLQTAYRKTIGKIV